jgi:hypothetical protein
MKPDPEVVVLADKIIADMSRWKRDYAEYFIQNKTLPPHPAHHETEDICHADTPTEKEK